MKYKGCLICFVFFLACVGSLAVVIRHIQNRLNPVYHGKHLLEWADGAVWAEDHMTRQRAAEVLRQARLREGEEVRLRVYKELLQFNRREGERKDQLPEELTPFLVEAFKEEDQNAGLVMAGLEKCPASQVMPPLIELLKDERQTRKKSYLIRALGQFGPKARAAIPLIRQSLQSENMGLRETAREALERIDSRETEIQGN
jgi:hypothetical protein